MKKAISCIAIAAMTFVIEAHAEAFVGAAVGSANWPSEACFPSASCDRNDVTWALRGGFMFNPFIGLEARYVHLGRATTSTGAVVGDSLNARFDAKGVGAGVALAYPFAQGFRLTGVAGVARIKAGTELSGSVYVVGEGTVSHFSRSRTENNPYVGVGVDYGFAPNLTVGLEATRYRVDFNGAPDIDAYTAEITYRFR